MQLHDTDGAREVCFKGSSRVPDSCTHLHMPSLRNGSGGAVLHATNRDGSVAARVSFPRGLGMRSWGCSAVFGRKGGWCPAHGC